MHNSKNFKFGKFKKNLDWKISKICNLANSKKIKIQFGNFQKFSFLKILKIVDLENSKNVQFGKLKKKLEFEKFSIPKILRIS